MNPIEAVSYIIKFLFWFFVIGGFVATIAVICISALAIFLRLVGPK